MMFVDAMVAGESGTDGNLDGQLTFEDFAASWLAIRPDDRGVRSGFAIRHNQQEIVKTDQRGRGGGQRRYTRAHGKEDHCQAFRPPVHNEGNEEATGRGGGQRQASESQAFQVTIRQGRISQIKRNADQRGRVRAADLGAILVGVDSSDRGV